MKKRNIPPLTIRGESEFAAAFGIKDPRTQAKLRSEGMPCYHDGSMFIYIPEEVINWMKQNWKINI
jgi:hypothetical protein